MHWCSELSWGNSQFALRGVADESKKWRDGTILKVQFLDGDQSQIDYALWAMSQWQQYVNLKFVVVDKSGVIRVSFKGDHAWSWVGTDALTVLDRAQPTVTLGGFTGNQSEDNLKWEVLHEFGHVLCLKHEMYNHSIPWNKKAIYEYYTEHYKWTKEMVDHNLFDVNKIYTSLTPPDQDSVMMYPIPPEFTDGKFVALDPHPELSMLDVRAISELYPIRGR